MKKANLLMIDDDLDFTQSVRMMLTAEGFDMRSAPNSTQGLKLAEEQTPDLFILDVMMNHDTEGFELARQIRSHESLKNVPIIMVTGIKRMMNLPFSFESDEKYLPVTRFLEKPVAPKDLLGAVKTILEIEEATNPIPKEERMDTTKKIKKALIIDDDTGFAEATKAVLETNGMVVATAENGSQGFDAAQQSDPDLILLDVMMENDSAGLDTLKKLKDNEKTAGKPVFLITGIKKPQFLTDGFAPGENFPNVKKYFEKPVEPEALLEAINSL